MVNIDKYGSYNEISFLAYHQHVNGMELILLNDDTCLSGHITRPTHDSEYSRKII